MSNDTSAASKRVSVGEARNRPSSSSSSDGSSSLSESSGPSAGTVPSPVGADERVAGASAAAAVPGDMVCSSNGRRSATGVKRRRSTRGRGRGGRGRGAAPKQGKDYAVSHGQKRGSFRGTDDAKPPSTPGEEDVPSDALGEGLYAFVQATICRRRMLAAIFKNKLPNVPPAECCDLCNPKLFDHTRPCKPVRATRQKGIRRGPPVDSVRAALFTWRRSIKKMHFARSVFAPHALLDDAPCELLASVGPIESLEMLQQLLEPGWSHWEEFGKRLYVYLHGLVIPPLPPPPARKNKASAAAAAPAASPSPAPVTAVAPSEPPAPALTVQDPNKWPHSVHNTTQRCLPIKNG